MNNYSKVELPDGFHSSDKGTSSERGKFTGFIVPVLNLIDDGTVFRKGIVLLYWVAAVSSFLVPFQFWFLFNHGFVGFLVLLPILFASWLGFQVYFNRMKKVKDLFKP